MEYMTQKKLPEMEYYIRRVQVYVRGTDSRAMRLGNIWQHLKIHQTRRYATKKKIDYRG